MAYQAQGRGPIGWIGRDERVEAESYRRISSWPKLDLIGRNAGEEGGFLLGAHPLGSADMKFGEAIGRGRPTPWQALRGPRGPFEAAGRPGRRSGRMRPRPTTRGVISTMPYTCPFEGMMDSMDSVDGHEEKYLSLFSTIEEVLRRAYAVSPRMRDVDALEAVKEARRAVGRHAGETSLTARSILSSVMILRRSDKYSQQEVMACLCQVSADIRCQMGNDGGHAYLESIAERVA